MRKLTVAVMILACLETGVSINPLCDFGTNLCGIEGDKDLVAQEESFVKPLTIISGSNLTGERDTTVKVNGSLRI